MKGEKKEWKNKAQNAVTQGPLTNIWEENIVLFTFQSLLRSIKLFLGNIDHKAKWLVIPFTFSGDQKNDRSNLLVC